jgi:hypothetical protein
MKVRLKAQEQLRHRLSHPRRISPATETLPLFLPSHQTLLQIITPLNPPKSISAPTALAHFPPSKPPSFPSTQPPNTPQFLHTPMKIAPAAHASMTSYCPGTFGFVNVSRSGIPRAKSQGERRARWWLREVERESGGMKLRIWAQRRACVAARERRRRFCILK